MAFSFLSRHYRGGLAGACVRRATHDDYPGVVSILKGRDQKMDYLPVMFHKYLENSRRRLYVCTHGNKIIGFEMFLLVDGGQTIVSQAGRVRSDFRGKGVISHTIEEGIKDTLQEYPVRRIVWTTLNASATLAMQTWNQEVQVSKWIGAHMDFTTTGLCKLLQNRNFLNIYANYDVNELRSLSLEDASILLENIKKPQNMMQNEFWCVKFEPFSPLSCNYDIPLIEFDSAVVTASGANHCAHDVSFGSLVKGVEKDRYFLDLYLDSQLDTRTKTQLLIRHVLKHFHLIAGKETTKDIRFIVEMHDQTIAKLGYDIIRGLVMKEMQFHRLEEHLNIFDCICFLCATELKPLNSQL